MIVLVTMFLGGIALFLLGMKMLTDGLKLSAGDSLRNLLSHWTSTPTKGVMSGILITAIVQSSSAVVFATIGFVNAGIMSLLQAVYVVYGSNVGTTFTALFAVIGSTSAAKRTASAHVLFNVVTGVLAFFLVGVYVEGIAYVFGSELSVATTVALFHTMKKMTGLVLFVPLTGQLVNGLERHFTGSDRAVDKPKYLDDTLLQTPTLAISALVFEIKRVGKKSRKAVRHVMKSDRSHTELNQYVETVDQLHLAVVAYIQKMHRLNMPPNLDYSLPQALRVLQYFREASEHAMAALHIKEQNNINDTIQKELKQLEDAVYELTLACDSEMAGFCLEKVIDHEEIVEKTYNEVKNAILTHGGQEKINVQTMLNLHEMIRNYKRVADQLSKAAHHMDDFNKLIEHVPGEGPGMEKE